MNGPIVPTRNVTLATGLTVFVHLVLSFLPPSLGADVTTAIATLVLAAIAVWRQDVKVTAGALASAATAVGLWLLETTGAPITDVQVGLFNTLVMFAAAWATSLSDDDGLVPDPVDAT